jgi:uncharacterized membrane protein
MNITLSNKTYLQFSRSMLALAAMLVLVLFAVLSYHRIMFGMMDMTHASQQATNNCLDLCITAASVSWAQLLGIIQQTFASTFFIVVILFAVVIIRALQTVQSSSLIRLLLYAKQRWKFKLLCLWSRLLQQGIIAPKLCA